MVIFICGFMGCGKSTFTKRLNNHNGWEVLDLDDAIFKSEKLEEETSLTQVIERRGWDFFRRKELDMIKDLVLCDSNKLVSLGGGALNGESLKIIKQARSKKKNVLLVWLAVPFATCFERIKDDPSRPLVKEGEESLKKLYEQRELFYQLSDIILTDQQLDKIHSPKQLIEFEN